ncbi:hypothetical protein ANN_15285 [Periplaneta americana]|uniref:Uncharacterized protein n=1 Tax=Periplaneta americana TaxID=6978 RepID=A0ABQ8SGE5_PERAM|nr:hypothetical protein ANN_15285 [Periplaneta americana]
MQENCSGGQSRKQAVQEEEEELPLHLILCHNVVFAIHSSKYLGASEDSQIFTTAFRSSAYSKHFGVQEEVVNQKFTHSSLVVNDGFLRENIYRHDVTKLYFQNKHSHILTPEHSPSSVESLDRLRKSYYRHEYIGYNSYIFNADVVIAMVIIGSEVRGFKSGRGR